MTILSTRSRGRLVGATSAGLLWLLVATGAMAGNNGTLKIHEAGTPFGTPNNDPMVCVFDVEAFGLDAGQSGFLTFAVQGGDAPTGAGAGPFAFGPADADGYAVAGSFHLPAGHYQATLSQDGAATDVKAKSKVFKVTCEDSGGGGGRG